MGQYPLLEAFMANQGNTKKIIGMGMASTSTNEVSSSSIGINTLEDLMNQQSGGYSRSDPTLWTINGQKVRIDSKLYQDYVDYWQAWGSSDIFQKYGIKESAQYRDEWTKQYLQNYNANKPTQPTATLPTMNQPTINQTAIQPTTSQLEGITTRLPTINQPAINQIKEDSYRLPQWTGNIEYNSWLKNWKKQNNINF